MDPLGILAVLEATVRTSTPLILAALAALFSERSGIVDIGIEGKMLFAAFVSAVLAAQTGSALVGAFGGIGISIVLSLLHGYASISQRGNQVVSGLAINLLASGLTATLGNAWYARGGQTPQLSGNARFSALDLPFAASVVDVPVLGPIYANLVSGQPGLIYIAFLAVPVAWWVIYETRFGLRLRAVGEHPAAVDTAGLSVSGLRYSAVVINGVLCGLAGTYLSVAQNASFGRDMTAGRGYLALAAVIFANWRPWPVLVACLLFGFLEALQARLQGVPVLGVELPVELIQAFPYILTVILVAGVTGRAEGPQASGRPYVKER